VILLEDSDLLARPALARDMLGDERGSANEIFQGAPHMKRALNGVVKAGFAAASVVLMSAQPTSAGNILPSGFASIHTDGIVGVLRAGSGWETGALLGEPSSIVDGVFLPESTQWNSGSYWWDQDPSVNTTPVVITITLHQLFTIDSFTVQADNNDTYRLEFWDGTAWQLAWDVPALAGFGLETRDSGLLPSITTDKLRFTATSGDNFFAVSEIQADGFAAAVPEPASLMLLGSGLVGAAARRRRQRA
jgi:hypothetical protein